MYMLELTTVLPLGHRELTSSLKFQDGHHYKLQVTALQTFSWNLQVNQAAEHAVSTLLICKYFNIILCMLLLKSPLHLIIYV